MDHEKNLTRLLYKLYSCSNYSAEDFLFIKHLGQVYHFKPKDAKELVSNPTIRYNALGLAALHGIGDPEVDYWYQYAAESFGLHYTSAGFKLLMAPSLFDKQPRTLKRDIRNVIDKEVYKRKRLDDMVLSNEIYI